MHVLSRAGPLNLVKSYERSNPTASRGADGGAGKRGQTQPDACAFTGAIGDRVIPVDDRSTANDDLLFVHPI